jgi:hypothetical protein
MLAHSWLLIPYHFTRLLVILGASAMSIGFNSNAEFAGAVYHVQTEDRGLHHPFVDTVVLFGGRVVYRRSTGYQDLLSEAAAPHEAALAARIEQQHRDILEGVRAGSLHLEEHHPAAITVKLCNPKSWLAAGQASLEVEVVSRPERRPVAGADVEVSIEDGEERGMLHFASQTDAQGRALLCFRMPSMAHQQNPALVIRARGAGKEDQLRYRLKARPRDTAPPIR